MQVIGGNKGGIVAIVEGLRGFVPFSQISTVGPALVDFLTLGVCLPIESALSVRLLGGEAGCDE